MEDKQEQIEKMAYSICTMRNVAEYITDCSKCGYNDEISCKRLKYARKFLEKGYRKASDVIDEFVERLRKRFEQTETIANSLHGRKNSEIDSIIKIIAEEMRKETEQ